MSEQKIPNALTAEEWRRGYTDRRNSDDVALLENGRIEVSEGMGDTVKVGPEILPALIALANAALPDSDPRKITREKVEQLREVLRNDDVPELYADLATWADALESYLPPEGA